MFGPKPMTGPFRSLVPITYMSARDMVAAIDTIETNYFGVAFPNSVVSVYSTKVEQIAESVAAPGVAVIGLNPLNIDPSGWGGEVSVNIAGGFYPLRWYRAPMIGIDPGFSDRGGKAWDVSLAFNGTNVYFANETGRFLVTGDRCVESIDVWVHSNYERGDSTTALSSWFNARDEAVAALRILATANPDTRFYVEGIDLPALAVGSGEAPAYEPPDTGNAQLARTHIIVEQSDPYNLSNIKILDTLEAEMALHDPDAAVEAALYVCWVVDLLEGTLSSGGRQMILLGSDLDSAPFTAVPASAWSQSGANIEGPVGGNFALTGSNVIWITRLA
jgi:hypothetical protein